MTCSVALCFVTLQQQLIKFREVLEAAVDLERIPDEYLIGEQRCTICCGFLVAVCAVM